MAEEALRCAFPDMVRLYAQANQLDDEDQAAAGALFMQNQLPFGAYRELTEKIIREAVPGQDLLTPLSDTDATFELEVEHQSAKRFIKALVKADARGVRADFHQMHEVKAPVDVKKLFPERLVPGELIQCSQLPEFIELDWTVDPERCTEYLKAWAWACGAPFSYYTWNDMNPKYSPDSFSDIGWRAFFDHSEYSLLWAENVKMAERQKDFNLSGSFNTDMEKDNQPETFVSAETEPLIAGK